jgi:hypothetical protein
VPQAFADAAQGWRYRSVTALRPPAIIQPLFAPGTAIRVADLLP